MNNHQGRLEHTGEMTKSWETHCAIKGLSRKQITAKQCLGREDEDQSLGREDEDQSRVLALHPVSNL
jgi:hypothetical protein